MSTQEMTAKIRELKQLKQMQDEISAEIETLQDCIKAEMTAREVDTMNIDVFKVSWKSVITNRLDTTALKKDLPELAQKYTKATESKRFTIA